MKKHLIIGKPISHSLSPKIHNYWFKQNNIDAVYKKISPEKNQIKEIIKDIKENEIYGMNVTIPYKQEVIPYLEQLSELAEKTNSVNTIFKKNGKICGDNTDVYGFEHSIKKFDYSVKNKIALIFGAGGVVPSIITALENMEIKKVYISNRNRDRIEIIKKTYPHIEEIEWGGIENFDIFINATSVGLDQKDDLNLDLKKIGKSKFFYDVIYNPPITNFLKKAKNFGHETLNGKMMFIYQAQKAFEIWHGLLPKIDEKLINFINND